MGGGNLKKRKNSLGEIHKATAHKEPAKSSPPKKKMSFLKRFTQVKYMILCMVLILVINHYQPYPILKNAMHNAFLKLGDGMPCLKNLMMHLHGPHQMNSGIKSSTKDHKWKVGPIKDPGVKMLTSNDIKYSEGGKLYLVIVGHVFDVSDGGAEYYKSGSGYHGFIGQDASRAFVSGDFTEKGLTDDLSGLESQDYIGLAGWLQFYLNHDKYKFIGYHIGRFFNEKGEETKDMEQFKKLIAQAEVAAAKEEDLRKLFPTCNVEWNSEKGSEVWCSAKSGGVDRDWIGYPRKFTENANKAARCACVHANYLADPRVQLYENCPSTSDRCHLPVETDK